MQQVDANSVKNHSDHPEIAKTVKYRMAALPVGLMECFTALEKIKFELYAGIQHVRNMLHQVLNQLYERVIAEIADRFNLSSSFGVGNADFYSAIKEIEANETTLKQLFRLSATGAEMTITSVTDSEIVLIDTVENVDVEAQETFLLKLAQQERADAISNLQQRFPEIGQFLRRLNDVSGVHFYDYLLICETTGAEPISEKEYRTLQELKPVDQETICWLLTEQEMLDRGVALYGNCYDHQVRVSVNRADDRDFRAGRPLLRVQRA